MIYYRNLPLLPAVHFTLLSPGLEKIKCLECPENASGTHTNVSVRLTLGGNVSMMTIVFSVY